MHLYYILQSIISSKQFFFESLNSVDSFLNLLTLLMRLLGSVPEVHKCDDGGIALESI